MAASTNLSRNGEPLEGRGAIDCVCEPCDRLTICEAFDAAPHPAHASASSMQILRRINGDTSFNSPATSASERRRPLSSDDARGVQQFSGTEHAPGRHHGGRFMYSISSAASCLSCGCVMT